MNNKKIIINAALKDKMNECAWAIVETLNGNFKLKTLLAADKNNDSIELEIFGNKEAAKRQFKKHIKELKSGGLI